MFKRTILSTYQYLTHNMGKYNTVNLSLDEPMHHIFFDHMKTSSLLGLSPNILSIHNIPDLNIKKIYFDKINYYDTSILNNINNKNNYKLKDEDIEQIQKKYKLLYNRARFIPKIPYLGYNMVDNKRTWYIWSYTDINIIDNKKEFINKFYENNFHKDKIIEKHILDFLLNIK